MQRTMPRNKDANIKGIAEKYGIPTTYSWQPALSMSPPWGACINLTRPRRQQQIPTLNIANIESLGLNEQDQKDLLAACDKHNALLRIFIDMERHQEEIVNAAMLCCDNLSNLEKDMFDCRLHVTNVVGTSNVNLQHRRHEHELPPSGA